MEPPTARVIIGLSAVAVAAGPDGAMQVLVTGPAGAEPGLPFGSFDPDGHRTFELAVRDFVTSQTGLALGWVEQLYTFGDKGREAPRAETGAAMAPGDRVVSVGYLALVPEAAVPARPDARWADWLAFFPWEDRRRAALVRREAALAVIRPGLAAWAAGAAGEAHRLARSRRVAAAFPDDPAGWRDEPVLERYELLYEAGLVPEASRDRARVRAAPVPQPDPALAATGQPMASDHRRILATAIGRLRAKLRYRSVALDLMGPAFTLSELQDRVEAICGQSLHKQNFRRAVEKSGLVQPTGQRRTETGGRPAELFGRAAEAQVPGAPGLKVPVLRQR